MKAFMLDMMVLMMPYMKIVFWVGVAAAAAGIALRIGKPVIGQNASGMYDSALLWAGRVAGIIGIFFLMCEVMGAVLGAAPQFNFGDASKFEFWLAPFWWAGAGLLVAAIVIGHGVPRAQNA